MVARIEKEAKPEVCERKPSWESKELLDPELHLLIKEWHELSSKEKDWFRQTLKMLREKKGEIQKL